MIEHLFRAVSVVLAFLSWPLAHAAAPEPRSIDVGGQQREYLL